MGKIPSVEEIKNYLEAFENASRENHVIRGSMSVLKNKRPYLREYEEYLGLENSSEEDQSVYD